MPQRHWRRAITFHPDCWNRCCKPWCGKASCEGRGDRAAVTANDILRAARTVEHEDEPAVIDFPLLREVVAPALAEAESAFSDALARISVEDLAHSATTLHNPQD